MQKLFTAVKYLTFGGHFAAVRRSRATLGASVIYFPVVGLALGLVLALINYLLRTVPGAGNPQHASDYRPGRPDRRQPPHRAQK